MSGAEPPRVVVLGMGNLLMGDEGVGVRCVEVLTWLTSADASSPEPEVWLSSSDPRARGSEADRGGEPRTPAMTREARGFLPSYVRLIDGGTSTHALLEELEDLELLIIVDAMIFGKAPGTVTLVEGDAVPAAFSNRLSPHQHGIGDLLASLRFLGRAPKRVALIGVEPARVELTASLSPEVSSALPEVCRQVARLAGVGAP